MPPAPQERRFKDAPARAQLLALYAEIDGLLAPFSCDASTDCCRFGVTGREPYPTAVELAEVQHAMRAASIELAAPRRTLALVRSGRAGRSGTSGAGDSDAQARGDAADIEAERRCPLLSAEGRCRIYASRPFGCRTFFCARATGPGKAPRQDIQRISRAIADLSARYAPTDPHPRPLTRALDAGDASASARRKRKG